MPNLAVPGVFGDDALLFGVAYFLVRVLHLVSAVCAGVMAYEAIRYREHRIRVRHPGVA